MPPLPSQPVRMFIANENSLLLSGLHLLLEQGGFEVIGRAANGSAAVEGTARLNPDVIVLGEHLPDMDGCLAARRIREESPHTKIVLLTESQDETRMIEALESGAAGYLSVRSASVDTLFEAIRSVANGYGFWSGRLAPVAARPDLSARERQVLRLIAEGVGTKEIAVRLGLSAKTIEAHRCNLMAKLKLRNVASLVRYAIRQGVIRP